MKIGLISDVHGNLPALDAVLGDMPDVDEIVCVGDIVGYNAWPSACLERVREACSVVIQGNHDRLVETPQEYAHNEMARAGLAHAKAELDQLQREWLRELPPRRDIAEGQVRLAHSHPDPEKLDTYVFPSEFTELRPYLDDSDALVIGHTHLQHEETVDGKRIVNPGSVGQPRDGNADAAYAVLDTDGPEIEMRRVPYDIDQVIAEVESLGLPTRTGTRLLDGS